MEKDIYRGRESSVRWHRTPCTKRTPIASTCNVLAIGSPINGCETFAHDAREKARSKQMQQTRTMRKVCSCDRIASINVRYNRTKLYRIATVQVMHARVFCFQTLAQRVDQPSFE